MVAIFVLLTILTLIAFDALLSRRRQSVQAVVPPKQINPHLADGLFLHSGHGWVQVEPGGRSEIGVDAFARGVVGAPDRVHAHSVGASLHQGQPMLTLERGGRSVQVPAPLSGRIEAVNPALDKHPTWWGESGNNGWAYTLRPERLGAEIDALRVAEAAAAWLRGQTVRLQEWLTKHAMEMSGGVPTLADGGAPVEGALDTLDDGAWEDFERDFLTEGATESR